MEICQTFQVLVQITFLAKNCDKGVFKTDCENLSFSVYTDGNQSVLANCILSMDDFNNQLSIVTIEDMINETKPIFKEVLNNEVSDHVAIFMATTQPMFFQVLKKLVKSTPTGHRRWHPLQILYWPHEVNINMTEEFPSCSLQFRRNFLPSLIKQHLTCLSNIMISDEILFVTTIECGQVTKYWRTWSVWEVYSYKHVAQSLHNKDKDDKPSLNTAILMGINEIVTLNWSNSKIFLKGGNVPPKLRRRSNFNQINIKVIAPQLNLEADWIKDNVTGEIRFIGGMAVNILKDFQKLLNFSLEILSGDFFITSSQPNVNMSGYKPVTADLLKLRQVEIMIGHTTPTVSRLKSVDILLPSSYNRLLAFVHQPEPSSAREIFADPLQPKLWLAFGVSWVVILLCIRISIKIYQRANTNSANFSDEEFSSDPYFWTFATISIHGWNIHPRRRSLRIMFYLGTFITAICYTAFSAELMSVLSIKVIPIPDLPTLFRNTKIPIQAALESSNIAEVIKGLQSEGKIKSSPSPFLPGLTGVRKVFQRPRAFIAYDHIFHLSRSFLNISDGEFCATISSFPVVTLTTAVNTAMTMPKNSPLRETFNHKIMFLKERGLLSRHQKILHRDGGTQCLPRDRSPTEAPLALHDLATAILIFLGGALLCPAILIVERLHHVWLQRSYTTATMNVITNPNNLNNCHNPHNPPDNSKRHHSIIPKLFKSKRMISFQP